MGRKDVEVCYKKGRRRKRKWRRKSRKGRTGEKVKQEKMEGKKDDKRRRLRNRWAVLGSVGLRGLNS
jgi:hypothetical protein